MVQLDEISGWGADIKHIFLSAMFQKQCLTRPPFSRLRRDPPRPAPKTWYDELRKNAVQLSPEKLHSPNNPNEIL